MVEAASLALADSLTADERAEDRVYPNLTRIRDISTLIAWKVIRASQLEVRMILESIFCF
jgi:malate dehydrogenase (oxaloacetate-decarboxylating)(NADP+)